MIYWPSRDTIFSPKETRIQFAGHCAGTLETITQTQTIA